jgi:hypothetical protein
MDSFKPRSQGDKNTSPSEEQEHGVPRYQRAHRIPAVAADASRAYAGPVHALHSRVFELLVME